ncbi:MAG TPA: helix-turn-helix domain-containing protein [Thermoanaerobaculia bacterium]|nr:helix-turn-helix domain-containing protein [Thermoanaerobaculia bacterium]
MRQQAQSEVLTRQLAGREVSHLAATEGQNLSVHFTDGTVLLIESCEDGLKIGIRQPGPSQPTQRQSEYLRFIGKYIRHFGRSPAESDIQRHFLVSAPAVNQMMQTLEQRGFITRQRGVARSIRLCDNVHV